MSCNSQPGDVDDDEVAKACLPVGEMLDTELNPGDAGFAPTFESANYSGAVVCKALASRIWWSQANLVGAFFWLLCASKCPTNTPAHRPSAGTATDNTKPHKRAIRGACDAPPSCRAAEPHARGRGRGVGLGVGLLTAPVSHSAGGAVR